VKISIDTEVICLNGSLKMIDEGVYSEWTTLVNCGVTGPQFIKFPHDACNQIIAAINAPIGIATFQSVSGCQGDEWGQ